MRNICFSNVNGNVKKKTENESIICEKTKLQNL